MNVSKGMNTIAVPQVGLVMIVTWKPDREPPSLPAVELHRITRESMIRRMKEDPEFTGIPIAYAYAGHMDDTGHPVIVIFPTPDHDGTLKIDYIPKPG